MEDFMRILLQSLVTTAWVVMLGRVFIRWVDPQFEKPLGQFLYSLTEPFLAPLRRVLPESGTFDLAPLALLIGLGLLMRFTWYL